MLFVGLVVVAVQAVKNKSGTYHPYWCPQKDPNVARKHARKGKVLEVPRGRRPRPSPLRPSGRRYFTGMHLKGVCLTVFVTGLSTIMTPVRMLRCILKLLFFNSYADATMVFPEYPETYLHTYLV